MPSLTRKVDYALIALTELADRTSETVSARDIAQCCGLPLPVLTNVLNQLVRSGLIVSSRGVKGGYALARNACEISVVDVVEAIEGAFRITACCPGPADDRPSDCEHFDRCRIVDPIHRIQEIIQDVLSQVTLEHLTKDNLPPGFESLPALLQRCDS